MKKAHTAHKSSGRIFARIEEHLRDLAGVPASEDVSTQKVLQMLGKNKVLTRRNINAISKLLKSAKNNKLTKAEFWALESVEGLIFVLLSIKTVINQAQQEIKRLSP